MTGIRLSAARTAGTNSRLSPLRNGSFRWTIPGLSMGEAAAKDGLTARRSSALARTKLRGPRNAWPPEEGFMTSQNRVFRRHWNRRELLSDAFRVGGGALAVTISARALGLSPA